MEVASSFTDDSLPGVRSLSFWLSCLERSGVPLPGRPMRFSFLCLMPSFLFFEDLSGGLGVSVPQSTGRSGNDEKEGTDI